MLQRKPAKRLGVNGAKDVKKHIWFKNYPWNDLYNNKLISPFIPPGEDNFDYKQDPNIYTQDDVHDALRKALLDKVKKSE